MNDATYRAAMQNARNYRESMAESRRYIKHKARILVRIESLLKALKAQSERCNYTPNHLLKLKQVAERTKVDI